MKQVFSSTDSGQVGFIQSVLDASNLFSEIRNDAVSQVIASGGVFASEIWVRDEDFSEAKELVAASLGS